MANILLIYPKPEQIKDSRFGFSLNLLYIASILKNSNYNVIKYLDYSLKQYSGAELNEFVSVCDIIIIEFDSFSLKRSLNINHGIKIVNLIKSKYPEKKIVVFGYDFILLKRRFKKADFTFTFEPEQHITNVISLLLNNINPEESIQESIIYDLDQLPFPDRSLIPEYAEYGGNIRHKPNLSKSTLLQTSRGCLNSCTFCQRKGWQKTFRAHSINYIINEVKYLSQNNYINIWITDDNFTFDLNRAKQILDNFIKNRLTNNMKIALSSWVNIDTDFLNIAKEANVSIISFGIESAENKILYFYKKDIDLDRVKYLITYADSIGLYTVGNFIIGAPMETKQTINQTFDFALSLPFDQVNMKILDYMIGSDIFENLPYQLKHNKRHIFACKEYGLNEFNITYLRQIINDFHNYFYKNRKKKITEKILKYGLPYAIKKPHHACESRYPEKVNRAELVK